MPSPSPSPAAEAWSLLQQVMMAQRGRLHAIAAEFELAPMQALALSLLSEPRMMRELAGELRCDTSNVTGIVDRLEHRGLVKRRAMPGDRRVKLLELTPEGERVREQLAARLSEPPEALARLPEADAEQLRDVLRRAVRVVAA